LTIEGLKGRFAEVLPELGFKALVFDEVDKKPIATFSTEVTTGVRSLYDLTSRIIMRIPGGVVTPFMAKYNALDEIALEIANDDELLKAVLGHKLAILDNKIAQDAKTRSERLESEKARRDVLRKELLSIDASHKEFEQQYAASKKHRDNERRELLTLQAPGADRAVLIDSADDSSMDKKHVVDEVPAKANAAPSDVVQVKKPQPVVPSAKASSAPQKNLTKLWGDYSDDESEEVKVNAKGFAPQKASAPPAKASGSLNASNAARAKLKARAANLKAESRSDFEISPDLLNKRVDALNANAATTFYERASTSMRTSTARPTIKSK
jgi:hypothetical protein